MRDKLILFGLILAYLICILRGPIEPPSQGAQLAFDFEAGNSPASRSVYYPTYPRGGWVKDASGVSPNARRLTRNSIRAYSGIERPQPKYCHWAVTPCGRDTHVRAWADLH
jgi:hypothetical protein